MSTSESDQVIIIGAGIGGLTTALHLHRVGIRSRVLEVVPKFAPVGVGISLLPHASRELGLLGLEAALTAGAILTKESIFFNRYGQLVFQEPTGRYAGFADPQYSIHRAHLHQVLLDAVVERLGDGAVLAGHKVLSITQDPNGATTRFEREDGSNGTCRSEVVIGADGIHSVARKQLFPNEGRPRYSGVTMWRGTTVWPSILSGASMARAGSLDTGQLVFYPIQENVDGNGNQLLNWVAEVRTSQREGRAWNQAGQAADFVDYYKDWHFDWLDVPEMIQAATTVLEYPMVDQDPLPRWTHGRLTLLGDAAHPMIPRGSNGAGQTIIDARVLADCLATKPSDPEAGLRAYEEIRRPVTSSIVVANRTKSPDLILHEVYRRTGDKPFERIEDVISADELQAIADSYRSITGAAALPRKDIRA